MAQKKLDCRILDFKKWILPKTKTYNSFNTDSLSIGYFDFVNVKKLTIDKGNPLEKYITYKNKKEEEYYKKFISDEYLEKNDFGLDSTSQQLFAFTNIDKDENENVNNAIYSEEKIAAFWEEPSLIRYYSLLHIENGTKPESVYSIISIIHDTFSSINNTLDKYNAVCYFSLDYSDIIICSKNISISDFTNSIFKINYNMPKKCIRDSFSLVAVEHNAIKSLYNTLGDVVNSENLPFQTISEQVESILSYLNYNTYVLKDEFTASFNIGVQNHNTLTALLKKLDDHHIYYDKYKLLGRHDIALYNPNANMLWIIVMQIFIDYFSNTLNKTNNLSEASILFNCETYIRIPYKNTVEYKDDVTPPHQTSRTSICYAHASEIMEKKIKAYTRKAVTKNNCVKQIHITPIYTLRNSILGLLKNGFAEDFVLCIFKSFLDFIDYISEKVDRNHVFDTSFDNTFNSYFDNINSLINSAMHSDRQFVQSPSFNPVFFDIPPKLMSYYTAITNKIFEIMNTDDSSPYSNYSFVFRPSFNSHIEVARYSYDDVPPANRLLAVKINETDLYYPFSVISQICHEVAHSVGDDNRQRSYRKYFFIQCILFSLAYNFMKQNLCINVDDTVIVQWVKAVMDYISKQPMYINASEYSDDLEKILYKTLIQINTVEQLNIITSNLFISISSLTKMEAIDCHSEFKNYTQRSIYTLIEKFQNKKDPLKESMYNLLSVFSEIYSDLQMLLILDISLDEYLSMFITMLPKNVDIRTNDKTYYRILNIVTLFILNGTWHIPNTNNNALYNNILKDICSYIDYIQSDNKIDFLAQMYKNPNISKVINKIECYKNSNWQGFHHWNLNIQFYLLHVYYNSKKCYEDEKRSKEIRLLRSSVKTLKDFDNAVEVFCNIQTTNEEYSNKLFSLIDDPI